MKYVLDTDTISYYLRSPKENFHIFLRIEEIDNDDMALTVINYSEILYGFISNSSISRKRLKIAMGFMDLLHFFDFDKKAAEIYANIKAKLSKAGNLLSDMDLMIASITMANDAVLVTHNTKHFSRIKGLKLEDWTW